MIAYVKGPLVVKEPTHIVVDCAGVGYRVKISLNTYTALQPMKEARVWTYLQAKEDGHTLYGFAEERERELFELLITVNGVGGNTALLMLSSLKPAELQSMIAMEDVTSLKKIKGIGQKTAERIVLELKGKILPGSTVAGSIAARATHPVREEALQALVALGFVRTQVEKRVDELLRSEPTLAVAELIKGALRG